MREFYILLILLFNSTFYSQVSNKDLLKRYFHIDTISTINISELILFNDHTYINIGITSSGEMGYAWYSAGRFLSLDNTLLFRSYVEINKSLEIENIQSQFQSKFKDFFSRFSVRSFKEVNFSDFKIEVRDHQLIDENNNTYILNN